MMHIIFILGLTNSSSDAVTHRRSCSSWRSNVKQTRMRWRTWKSGRRRQQPFDEVKMVKLIWGWTNNYSKVIKPHRSQHFGDEHS